VAERTGNAIPVQVGRDGSWRLSHRKLQDAADNRGLGFIDLALAPNRLALTVDALHHVVTVAESAAGLALLYPPAQTAMGFRGKVFQEQRIHRAFEADMKLGDFAFGQGDGLHAGETEVLEQGRHVSLIARDAIQCFGKYDVEPATLGVLQQRLDTRSKNDAGAGDGRVLISINDLPMLLASMLVTDAELILDRGYALVVGRIASVKRNLGHDVLSGSGHHIDSTISAAVKMLVFTSALFAPRV
jgi:hypothetical protein